MIGGFLPASKTSKPPQSVASINFSQLDDANSEALIRAYKKKKAELDLKLKPIRSLGYPAIPKHRDQGNLSFQLDFCTLVDELGTLKLL